MKRKGGADKKTGDVWAWLHRDPKAKAHLLVQPARHGDGGALVTRCNRVLAYRRVRKIVDDRPPVDVCRHCWWYEGVPQ